VWTGLETVLVIMEGRTNSEGTAILALLRGADGKDCLAGRGLGGQKEHEEESVKSNNMKLEGHDAHNRSPGQRLRA
jgi:hypothetical protein